MAEAYGDPSALSPLVHLEQVSGGLHVERSVGHRTHQGLESVSSQSSGSLMPIVCGCAPELLSGGV